MTSRVLVSDAFWGVEVLSLADGRVLYEENARRLFVPGSTAKLVSEGAALHILGPHLVLRTRVYRTGPIERGRLAGDVVLVGAGDCNLSGRVKPDGTLTFKNQDHS